MIYFLKGAMFYFELKKIVLHERMEKWKKSITESYRNLAWRWNLFRNVMAYVYSSNYWHFFLCLSSSANLIKFGNVCLFAWMCLSPFKEYFSPSYKASYSDSTTKKFLFFFCCVIFRFSDSFLFFYFVFIISAATMIMYMKFPVWQSAILSCVHYFFYCTFKWFNCVGFSLFWPERSWP